MDGANLVSPSGLMCEGNSLWVVDSGTDKVYQYPIDQLFFLYDVAFNTASKISDETGILSEETLAAETMSTWWEINAIWEFSLVAGNDNATGM